MRIAVEERGPTEDEIALARAARELRSVQSMQNRPKPRARKKRSRKSRSPVRGGKRGSRSKSPTGSSVELSQAEIKAQKAARKAKIMARQLELERERRADQKRAWKRRYAFDIDEAIDPWNLCIVVYELCNVILTEEDAGELLAPLLASERADDAETYERAIAAGRTKRLRVIVEKQGMPPREWPMRKTVLTHMVANKDYWMNLSHSTNFVKEEPDSRPSSRASSRRGRRSRGRVTPWVTWDSWRWVRPGISRGCFTASFKRNRWEWKSWVSAWLSGWVPARYCSIKHVVRHVFVQAKHFFPHYWAHRAKLSLASRFRRMRQVGRKVISEMKDYASKLSPARPDPALKNLSKVSKKNNNMGKSKADRKAAQTQVGDTGENETGC